MSDKTNGSTIEHKRERIGLSLAPDVMDILNKCGQSLMLKRGATALQLKEWCEDKRPTRTEIIEQAVREWRQARLPKVADLPGSDPREDASVFDPPSSATREKQQSSAAFRGSFPKPEKKG